VLVREATDADRAAARALFEQDFGRTKIVAFGEVMDLEAAARLSADRSRAEQHHRAHEADGAGLAGIPARDEVRLEKTP